MFQACQLSIPRAGGAVDRWIMGLGIVWVGGRTRPVSG